MGRCIGSVGRKLGCGRRIFDGREKLECWTGQGGDRTEVWGDKFGSAVRDFGSVGTGLRGRGNSDMVQNLYWLH